MLMALISSFSSRSEDLIAVLRIKKEHYKWKPVRDGQNEKSADIKKMLKVHKSGRLLALFHTMPKKYILNLHHSKYYLFS